MSPVTEVDEPGERVLPDFPLEWSTTVPLMARIKNFLSSPQGKRVTEQGRRMASDPRRRQQAKGLLAKLRGRRA